MAITIQRQRLTVSAADLTLLVGALGVASVVEFASLRILTRTAVHIPALDQLENPYGWVSDSGRYAYFVEMALLIPALALLAVRLGANSRIRPLPVAVFVAAAVVSSFGLLHRAFLDIATISAIALMAALIAADLPYRRSAIPIGLFGAATVGSGLFVAISSVAELGFSMRQPAVLLTGSEYLGLGFALTSPLLVARKIDTASQIAGAGVGLFVAMLFLGGEATVRFLLLWNVGLSGILPGVFYAVAAGALTLTIVALGRGRSPLAAIGVLLLVTGGIGLQNTYQSGLVMAGLAALAIALVSDRLPESDSCSKTAA